MEKDLAKVIADSNSEAVERARQAAAEPSTLDRIGDTATQLDTLDQIVELGGVVISGLRATGDCIAAICDAVSTLD